MMTLALISLLGMSPPSENPDRSSGNVSAADSRATLGWRARQRWPIKVAAGADSLGFYPQAAHPVGMVGTELTHVVRRRFALVQPIELGYLVHRRFSHGPSLDTGLGVRWTFAFGLDVGARLGVGVQHALLPRSYVSDGEGYRRARDPGRTSARVGLGATLGYDFTRRTRLRLRLFARYQQILLAPFAAKNALPVMGRAQVLFGFAVPLGRRSQP